MVIQLSKIRKVGCDAVAGVLLGLLLAGNAQAQVMQLGYWAMDLYEDFDERVPGPSAGDYTGLPINEALRLHGDTWSPSLLEVPEHQCQPHPPTYGFRSVGTMRIWETRDPDTQRLVKINTQIEWMEQHREIWMDGRPHPPEAAPHTWQGFSTGKLEGDVLVVHTTHLKAGWIRRNGLALSDRATVTERFYRHGDILTHVSLVEDPAYLTEPLLRTNGFHLVPNGAIGPFSCRPTIAASHPAGEVPHNHLGDENASKEYATQYNLPLGAVRGGAETALPEFMKTVRPAAAPVR